MLNRVLVFVDANGRIMPLIDFPHNDIENGQPEVHYHADMRYVDFKNKSTETYTDDLRISLPLKAGEKLEWRELPLLHPEEHYISPLKLIVNSKLKHKCIHKGKCPHRGYDLSGVKPAGGAIQCPMHGLRFSASNGNLLYDDEVFLKQSKVATEDYHHNTIHY